MYRCEIELDEKIQSPAIHFRYYGNNIHFPNGVAIIVKISLFIAMATQVGN